MRYLGIDYGSKRVGLALSDEAGTMGFPHAVIPNTPELAEVLKALVRREGVGAVVIGDPRGLTGDPNTIAAEVASLIAALAKEGISIHLESEAFTTAEARRMPGKTVKSRKTKRPPPVDASAAALILTSYLSRTRHG